MRSWRKSRVFVCGVLICGILLSCASDEEEKARHIKDGKAYFEKGAYNKALIEFKNAAQIDPGNESAHTWLADTYLKLKNGKEAVRSLTKVVSLNPANTESRIKLATLYFFGRDNKEARSHIDEVLKTDPNNVKALILLAGIHEESKNLADAEAVFKKIIGSDKKSDVAHLGLARILTRQQRFEKAEETLLAAVKIDPAKVEPRLALYSFYLGRKKPDRAEAEIKSAVAYHPEDPKLLLTLADFYSHQKKTDQAESAYVKAIELDSENERYYLAAADFYTSLKKNDKALSIFQKAEAISGQSAGVLTAIARFHFASGSVEESEKYIQKVLAKRPEFFAARMLQAEILVSKRKFQEGLAVLDQIIKEEPNHARANYFKGIAHLGTGEVRISKAAFAKAVESDPRWVQARLFLAELNFREMSYDLAIKECDRILALEPENYPATLISGNAYMYKQNVAKAQEAFKKLVQLAPEHYTGYFRLGVLEQLLKKYPQALGNFQKALKLNPQGGMEVFPYIIRLYASQKDYDAALAFSAQHLKTMQNNPQAVAFIHHIRGSLYLTVNKEPEAEASFRAALIANPDYFSAYHSLAGLLHKQGRDADAIQQYLASIEKNPDQAAPHMFLGIIYDSRKDYGQAEKYYRAALKINPDFVPAANNLAYLLGKQNRELNEAFELARKAKEKHPQDPGIMDTMGFLYLKKNLYSSAIAEFSESLEKLPGAGLVRYHLAMAYYGAGQKDKAEQELKEALGQKDSFEEMDAARQLLKRISNELSQQRG
ncbi:MAG: tetratricopeptide repeat protein [Desulfobacterales bacterium]|nr:tetratricopeptide repeat protein [Desulfobacterales bacterium]